eukprot:EG_transcript_23822
MAASPPAPPAPPTPPPTDGGGLGDVITIGVPVAVATVAAAAVGAGVWVGLQRLAPGSAPLGAAPFFQPPPAAPAPPMLQPTPTPVASSYGPLASPDSLVASPTPVNQRSQDAYPEFLSAPNASPQIYFVDYPKY